MKYLKSFKIFESMGMGTDLIFEAALLLKVDDSIKQSALNLLKESDASDLFPLPEDKLHITLTSIKGCKANKDMLKSSLPQDINPPKIELGEVTTAERTEAGKKSFVVAISNQDEIKKYVDEIYSKLGLENPEQERYFHMTIANNVENKKSPGVADPFGSIGDITKNDFK
jgi:2'-5' RNA ligase